MMNENFPYPRFVDIGDEKEFLHALSKFSKKIEDIIKKTHDRSTVLVENNLITTSYLDIPFLSLGIIADSQAEFLVRNILIANIENLEKRTSLGAHFYCMAIGWMCDEIKRRMASVDRSDYQYYDHLDSELKLRHFSKRTSINDVSKILKNLIDDKEALDIFNAATSLAGAEGHITIKDENKKFDTIIEMSNMFKFMFGLDINFIKNAKFSQMELKNPRIIIIDGFFEATSEIERFLFYASKNHESLIVIARGFSEEVTTTLAHNFTVNNLQIFPIAVPLDLYGANALKDLACIVGNDIVSTLKGELISSIPIDEHNTVEKVTLLKDRLLIKEQRNLVSVKSHLHNLTEKQLEIQNDDLKNILQKRIKTLLSRHVEIKLGKDSTMLSPMLNQRLRKSISVFNEICHYGIIEPVGLSSNNTMLTKFEKKLILAVQRLGKHALPTRSLESAIEAINATKCLLLRTGAYVISSD